MKLPILIALQLAAILASSFTGGFDKLQPNEVDGVMDQASKVVDDDSSHDNLLSDLMKKINGDPTLIATLTPAKIEAVVGHITNNRYKNFPEVFLQCTKIMEKKDMKNEVVRTLKKLTVAGTAPVHYYKIPVSVLDKGKVIEKLLLNAVKTDSAAKSHVHAILMRANASQLEKIIEKKPADFTFKLGDVNALNTAINDTNYTARLRDNISPKVFETMRVATVPALVLNDFAEVLKLLNASVFSSLKSKDFKDLYDGGKLVEIIEALTTATEKITDYQNIPKELFGKKDVVQALIANLDADADKFFSQLSLEQFTVVIKNKDFYQGKLSCAALNELAATKGNDANKFIKEGLVTAKVLDTLYGHNSTPFNKEVVELLPAGFLNEITVPPHADEAEHYTSKNFKLLTSPKVKLNLIKAPVDEIRYLAAEGKHLYKMLTLSDEQKSQLSVGQWNSVLVKVKTCKKFASSANFDFRSTSEIVVDAECFAALPAKNQVDLILRGRLPADVLSRVSKDIVEKWEHGDKKGLAVFDSMKDKSLLKDFATHADVQGSKHPLKGKSQSEVTEYRTLAVNLNAGCLAAMVIEAPSNYEDVKKYGKFIRASEKILEWLEKIDQQHIKDKKESLWAKLTKEQMADLTGSSSILMSQMKKDVFGKLSPSARSGISGEALATYKDLKEVTKEQYAELSEDAFTHISADQKDIVRLADMSDAQLGKLSVEAQKSIFTVLPAATIVSLATARAGVFQERQVAAFPAATAKDVFTATLTPTFTAESLTLFSKAQAKEFTDDHFKAFNAEQAEKISLGLDDKQSIIPLFASRIKLLDPKVQEVINARLGQAVAESSASMVKPALAMALPLLMLLL